MQWQYSIVSLFDAKHCFKSIRHSSKNICQAIVIPLGSKFFVFYSNSENESSHRDCLVSRVTQTQMDQSPLLYLFNQYHKKKYCYKGHDQSNPLGRVILFNLLVLFGSGCHGNKSVGYCTDQQRPCKSSIYKERFLCTNKETDLDVILNVLDPASNMSFVVTLRRVGTSAILMCLPALVN